MSKDKIINERTSSGRSDGDAPDQFDAACLSVYLDSISNDLEVSPRDPDETVRQHAERLRSAVQDTRYALNDELNQLEHDLQNVITHIDEGAS